MKRKLVYSKMESCVSTEKKKLPDGQQQQAISIYFFLEGLGFRVEIPARPQTTNPGQASDHELLASDHELLASDHELLASDHELLASDHELLASDHELLASNRELLASNREFLASNREGH